jgi:predicted nucleic acid-binding protein
LVVTTIDRSRIASRTLWDSNVLIDALLGHNTHPEPPATLLLRETFAAGGTVVISAVSLAEIWNDRPFASALMGLVELAEFGSSAAQVLAERLPKSELRHFAAPGVEHMLKYYRYDALILASGVAKGIDAVLSTDQGMQRLAGRLRIPCRDVDYFIL